jgi:hypothetical protein
MSSTSAEALGWAGLLVLIVLYNKLNEFQPLLYHGGILVIALASALLIVGAATPGTSIGRLLEARLLRWIGSRSYSIYLWHWPVFMLTRPGIDVHLPPLFVRGIQVALTFALAELSYRWVETPVRREGFRASLRSLRRTFGGWSMPQKLGVGAGVLGSGLLLIWQGTLSPVTASAPPEETPTTQSTPLPHVLFVTATEPAATAAPPPRASTSSTAAPVIRSPTRAPDLPRVTLIGDSIMQGAAPMIEDVFGEDIYIDAARKRKMEDVPALVETLDRQGHLSGVVVIHLGSNRPFEDPVFDQVMETLLAHGVERVLFMNVHRPIGWESYINRKFEAGVARWP